jgi:hypothetical protein
MGIRDRQLTNEAERIMRAELLEGRYPTLSMIQDLAAQKFKARPAGLPRFELKPVSNKQVSNAAHYNEMIENLSEDLQSAYQESRYQGDRMMALADYYETEKLRISLQIRKLNRRMEILNEKLKDRGLRTVIFDTFNDYLSIEFDGDGKRSLPETNVFVDLRNGYATLDNIQNGSSKINLADALATIKPITEFTDFSQLSKVEGALLDTINEAWRHVGTLTEAKEAEIVLQLQLMKPSVINVASIIPQSPRPSIITLRTSKDGENFKTHAAKTVTGFTEWNFEEESIQYIEFHIKKIEPDIASGAEYLYYFGAQDISLRHTSFISEGVLVSKPHKIDRVVDKLTLNVDEVIPPGTGIKYFVAEDKRDGGVLDWQTIEPNQKVELNGLLTEEINIDKNTSGYRGFYQNLYGQDYFTIAGLTKTPIERTAVLYMGDDMWQVDSLDHGGEATFKPTLDTWKTIYEYDRAFVPMEHVSAGSEMTIAAGKLGRMTLYLTMSKDYSLLANPMDITGANVSVYLNNTEIKGINGDYTFNFKKGLNKVEVLYYSHGGGRIAPNLSKVYMEAIGAITMGATNEPLKQVDVYDLMNNTSKKDFSKFSIDVNNKIVVNYDPVALDVTGQGLKYRLAYRYPKDTTKTSTYLRFMARLSHQNQDDLTPILNSYKLIIE